MLVGQRRRQRGGTADTVATVTAAAQLLYDAVYLAANDVMKKEQGHKALIILSDGVDRGSKETIEDPRLKPPSRADTLVYSIPLRRPRRA